MRLFSKKNDLYKRVLIYITVIVSSTIFIVSILQYGYARKDFTNKISNYNTESLKYISYSAQFMYDSAQNLMSQLNLEPDISVLLNSRLPDEQKTITAMQRLSTLKTSLNFIQSIYLYNGSNNTFYTTISDQSVITEKSFFDTEIASLLRQQQKISRSLPIARKILLPNVPNDEKNYTSVFTFLYTDRSISGSVDSAIVVNISEQWLQSVIRNLNLKNTENIVVIDSSGNIVSSNLNTSQAEEFKMAPFFQEISSTSSPSGELSAKLYGSKSLLNYVSMDNLKWKFIRILPYEVFTHELNTQLLRTSLFSLFILFLGFILSIFLGRMVYRPINSVVSKLQGQLIDTRADQSDLKNSLFSKLLLDEDVNFKETEQKLKKIGTPIYADTHIALLVLKIDNLQDFCNKYSAIDRSLVKFSILNIASEFISKLYVNEPVDVDKNHVALIIKIENNKQLFTSEAFKKAILDTMDAVQEYLELSLTAAVSSTSKFNADISKLYDEAAEISNYFFSSGKKSIMFCEEFDIISSDKYKYPQEKSKLMFDNLMLGKFNESLEIFTEIIESTKGYSFSTMQIVLSRVIIQISDILDQMGKNHEVSLSGYQIAFITAINSADSIEQISHAYTDLLNKLQSVYDQKKSGKHEDLIKQIQGLIDQNYSDANLCLSSVADTFGMSSVYLGRIFKNYTSKSISDCINEVRLQKSMELLKSSAKPVSDIIASTGFTNDKYFFTIFKKYNGITPTEYRLKTK